MSLKIIAYEFDTMTEELLKKLGIAFNGLAIRGGILLNLVQSLPEPAHIKDAKTGKYICSNESNLEVYGLHDVSQILGKTVHDLDSFMKPFWGDSFAGNISSFDTEVCKCKEVMQETNKIFIAKNGIIHVQDMTKAPIFDGNKISAIFTHSHDKTSNMDLLALLDIYQKVYDNKEESMLYLCKFLKIDLFFHEMPSVAEIRFLLNAKDWGSVKDTAEKMHRGEATLLTHSQSINSKLKNEYKDKKIKYTDIIQIIRISHSPSLKIKEEKA